MNYLDTLAKKAGAIATILALITALSAGFAAIHSQYASAEDVDSLAGIIRQDRIDEKQEEAAEVGLQIARLTAKDRTQEESEDLELLKQKLARINKTLDMLRLSE